MTDPTLAMHIKIKLTKPNPLVTASNSIVGSQLIDALLSPTRNMEQQIGMKGCPNFVGADSTSAPCDVIQKKKGQG